MRCCYCSVRKSDSVPRFHLWLVEYLIDGNGVPSWLLGEFFSTWGDKYHLHMEGSTQDEIEPMWGEIEHQNEHPSWGSVSQMGYLGSGARVGGGGGQGQGGAGAPIWHPIHLSGIPSPYLASHPINESLKWYSSLLDIFAVHPDWRRKLSLVLNRTQFQCFEQHSKTYGKAP